MILKNDLHILLPAFNEAKSIEKVILDLQKIGFNNIITINDGSEDDTKQIAQKVNAKVISHSINRGVGAAVQTGIEYARKNNIHYLVLMDSDGQHYLEDIEKLSQRMTETNADIVIGSRFRFQKNEIPKTRKFYNQLANILTNFFCKKNYSDSQSGFRMLNRKAIETLNLNIDRFGFCSEMIWKGEQRKLKIFETPIRVLYSIYSMQKGQNFGTGLETAFDLLLERFFGRKEN